MGKHTYPQTYSTSLRKYFVVLLFTLLGLSCDSNDNQTPSLEDQELNSELKGSVKPDNMLDHLLKPLVAEHCIVWAPDGKTIAFLSDSTKKIELWLKNADGSGHRQLTNQGVAYGKSAWSPDGRKIAFLSDKAGNEDCNVWTVDVEIGPSSAQALTKSDQNLDCSEWKRSGVTWEPSGDRIAFTTEIAGKSAIRFINVNNGAIETVIQGDADYILPDWSPDGKKLILSSNRSGEWDIWTYALDNHTYQHIMDRIGDQFQPVWAPDGNRIGFLEVQGGIHSNWVTTVTGRKPIRITDPREMTGDGTWSPDGKQFGHTALNPETDIWLYELSTGKASRIINQAHMLAAWSPDSKEIAYLKKNEDFGHDIWKLDISTGATLRLTNDGRVSHKWASIGWSPNGRFLSYTAGLDQDKDLWLMSPNGGQEQPITMDDYQDSWHCWSPNSKEIAYTSKRNDKNGLWIIPASGGKARALLQWDQSYSGCSWSPDGSQISFWSEKEVWITDIDGKHPRKLAKGFAPTWSPDGQSIYYTDWRPVVNRVMNIDIETGEAKVILNAKRVLVQNVSPDGQNLLITQFALRGIRVRNDIPTFKNLLP